MSNPAEVEIQRLHQIIRNLTGLIYNLTGLHVFSFQEVDKATDSFHEQRRIGTGGFGSVYRCMLEVQDKLETMAVKRLSLESIQGKKEFANEIKLLCQLKHRNIMTLSGLVSDAKQPCIITPFYIRGSLQHALRADRTAQLAFTGMDRVGACLDVANGIVYLHSRNPPIWHLDLKRKCYLNPCLSKHIYTC